MIKNKCKNQANKIAKLIFFNIIVIIFFIAK